MKKAILLFVSLSFATACSRPAGSYHVVNYIIDSRGLISALLVNSSNADTTAIDYLTIPEYDYLARTGNIPFTYKVLDIETGADLYIVDGIDAYNAGDTAWRDDSALYPDVMSAPDNAMEVVIK